MFTELASVFMVLHERFGLVKAHEITQEFAETHYKEILSLLVSEVYGYTK